MKLGSRAAEVYVLLTATVFLLLAPCFAPEGGYASMTGFKAVLYAALTLLFLLVSLPDLPRPKAFFREPARLLALGMLLFCLLSALCSPWRRTAFLGGSRREGFLHLALYLASFLLLSCRPLPRREGLTVCFAGAVLLEDGICLCQLAGFDPLGLYPPGLGWEDANLRYAGSYLGTLGNAGQTGAVLSAAAALFFLLILRRGGKRYLLLPPLLLSALVLALMDVTAPMLALGAVLLFSLVPYGKTLGELLRWGCLAFLTAAFLFLQLLGWGPALGLTLLSLACYLLERRLPGDQPCRAASLCLLGFLCLLGLVFLLGYRGWYAPLREASALLRGEGSEDAGSGRVYIWKQVLAAVPAHLWLGTGPDTLSLRNLSPYVYEAAEAGRTVTLGIDAAHCEPLHTLVCCGLPAALCHLGLFVCAGIGFFRRREAGRSCAGAAFCYALQALTGISMCQSAPVFWILLALSLTEGGLFSETDEQK